AWTSRPITSSLPPVAPSVRWLLILPPLFRLGREPRPLLDRETGVEHALLVERLADHLQAERQSIGIEARRHAHRREAGKAGGDREHVVQIHRQRIVDLVAEREGGGRRSRGEDHVAL